MREIVIERTWRERLEELAGARRDTALAAAIALVGIAVGLVLWARGTPPQVAPPAESPPVATAARGPASRPARRVVIHVAGAVRRPGLYEIDPQARIADAIDLARGPLPRADLNALNLAAPVTDGQQIYVPERGETIPAAATPASTSPAGTPAMVVDVNTADQVTLETIPGVGPVTALAIIEYRESNGPFESVAQLLEVSGIGPATLEAIRPYVSA